MKTLQMAAAEFRQTGDGQKFRDDVRLATYARRSAYSVRNSESRFADIVNNMNKPLTDKEMQNMSANDIALRRYYDLMYADNMYDEFGNYDWDKADQIRSMFTQEQLDYIEEQMGVKQQSYPEEFKFLKQVQKYLQPYWDIENRVWAGLPKELKELSDQLEIIGQTDPDREKQILRQYPQIVWARNMVLKMRKQARQYNPQLAYYIRLFY